jgi:ribosomal protein S18 acetylase RimI-like enzyme
MIDRALLARLRIEPLDRKKHDRAAFSCGVERVDNFLKKTATRQQDHGHTRVSVACLDASDTVIGYYALNAHAIDASTLLEADRKKLPSYPTISAIYLSIVGVQKEHQGSGLGSYLMADAFKRAAEAAEIVGAYFFVLDALNERAAKLYRKLGFIDLPGHEPRMIITMSQVRSATKLAG